MDAFPVRARVLVATDGLSSCAQAGNRNVELSVERIVRILVSGCCRDAASCWIFGLTTSLEQRAMTVGR